MADRQELIKKAMQHPDRLGAGAAKRRSLKLTRPEKVHTVMKEFSKGTLHSGSGGMVKSRAQAIAIALSEARKHK